MTAVTTEKSSTGLDANVAAMLSYVCGVITGLIFFLIEKQSPYVRFHAMQSMLLSVAFFVLSIVSGWLPVLGLIVTLAGLVLWIVLMVKAYHGERWKLPMIGDLAERNAALPTK